MQRTLETGVESHRLAVTTGGESIELRYLEAGTGPPVVLLHGIGLDAATVSWRSTLPALATNHRVIAPDLPGHGESEKPPREYTTEFFVEVLGEFLDTLNVEEPSLVGTSMGGALALGHVLDGNPVEGLVLASSYGLGSDAAWRPPGYFLLRTPGFGSVLGTSLTNPVAINAAITSMTVSPVPDLAGDVREAVSDPAVGHTIASWQRDEFRTNGLKTCYTNRLGGIDVPTLVLHGNEDPVFPVGQSERATERLPNGRFVPFERCGHWIARERPARFESVVGEFLSQ